MATARSDRRPDDIEAVYESSYPVNPNTGERFRTFEQFLASGCKSFLDFSPAERAVVDAYLALASRTG